MSDRPVLSLVSAVSKEQQAKDKILALHKPHLEQLLAEFLNGEKSYLIISVDDDGFTTFLTDMGAYQANFELDKVKLNMMFPVGEDEA